MITNVTLTIVRDEIYGGWEVAKPIQETENCIDTFRFDTIAQVRDWLRLHFGCATVAKVCAGMYQADVTLA